MDVAIYSLCALTALACATLLLRSYGLTRFRLLFWSGLCFVGLTLTNVLLVLDKFVFTEVDLSTLRLTLSLLSVLVLLAALVLETGR